MEICDPEKQDRYFSQPSNSKLLDEISDFPLSFIGLNEEKNKRFSLFGATILTFAILCGSSIGPVSNMYGDVNPFLKNIWRCQLSFILSAPFVIYALKHNSRAFDFEYISSRSGIITMIISGLFLTGALVTFIASSWLTIASHTYVLHSLSGVIIILYKVLSNTNVHFLEKAGSLAVIVGAVFLLCDPNVKKIGDQQTSILGEILVIICACFFALYLPCNKILIRKIPGLAILMINSLVSISCCIIVMIIINEGNTSKLFSFDAHEGIFGLFSYEQIKISILLGPIGMSIGGYTLALKYFQPHIVGNAFVVEPFLGQFLGCITHQDQVPGILTFIGGIITILAIMIVAKGSNESAKSD